MQLFSRNFVTRQMTPFKREKYQRIYFNSEDVLMQGAARSF